MDQNDERFQGRRRRGQYRDYEPHVRELVALSGKWDLFPDLGIPRNTAESWIERGYQGLDEKLGAFADHYVDLSRSLKSNQRKQFEADAKIRLLIQAQAAIGAELNTRKIRSPEIRSKLLKIVENALVECVPLHLCLATLGLTRSRFKRWRRESKKCHTNPTHLCIQLRPSQLTPKEIRVMRYFVTTKAFSHFPVRSLHFLARRRRKLSCAYSTWLRYIHLMKWRRPKRTRKLKKRRMIGVRARRPGEIWHMDVTQVILPDRSKIYVQAIVDNYSRYVLSWHVSRKYSGVKTTRLLVRALKQSYAVNGVKVPDVYVDGGGENNNSKVERLVRQKLIRKTIAQCDVSFSNSIVETLFRSLKHNHLYHVVLRDFETVRREVCFYLSEHNDRMPHSSFDGETPKERFLATWTDADRVKLVLQNGEARQLRIKDNQLVFCRTCETPPSGK